MTRLYIADVTELDIGSCLGAVSQYRREKTLRLKSDGDRRRSLGAELLLGKVTGQSGYALTENGKPCFTCGGGFFSLAHCGDYALCAVSDAPVGADIELARAGSLRLAERFFLPDEAVLVKAARNPDDEFCRLWTLKESYIKAADLRLGDVRSFSVVHGVAGFRFHGLRYGSYHIGCCVSAQETGNIELTEEKL